MKAALYSLLAAALLVATPAAAQHWREHSSAVQAVDPAVRAPLEAYLRGHATGDPEAYRQAFHPDSELWGTRNGVMARMTGQAYVAMANGTPPADEAQRRRWIESIDVSGDTAVGKIILDYPRVRFTDYISLMRVEGRWVIVNKMYLAEPKPAA